LSITCDRSFYKTKTDKYRLVEDHSCNTFLYTIINTMALIISIADIPKWTVPSVMSYAITLENTHWEGVNVMVMVFNTTFNIILLISWQSMLFVEENGVPGESQRSVASNWQTLLHSVVWVRFELTTLLVIGRLSQQFPVRIYILISFLTTVLLSQTLITISLSSCTYINKSHVM
jgi:hypothetical protein